MFFKFRPEFFSRNLFSFLIAVSLAIHALIIFFSPQANQILSLKSFRERFIRVPSEYTVTFDLENSGTQKEKTAALDPKQNEREIKKKEEVEKKKYKLFTDTSENKNDEEPQVDSDKIGEKGAIAKDNFRDDKQPTNNEPHAEGHSKAPLLGMGETGFTGVGQQQPQQQESTAQANVSEIASQDKNSPPRFANLPEGLEKQPKATKSMQQPPAQKLLKENTVKAVPAEREKFQETTNKENTLQTPKRERLTIGSSIKPEEGTEPVPDREGVLFTDKQDELKKKLEREESLLSPSREQRITKESNQGSEKPGETEKQKTDVTQKTKEPEPPSELEGIEPQRRLERGLDEQENSGASAKPKFSINVNAKKDGASKDPALFEDTISNAVVPGLPSFNVKKHEYAAYFKHIRDRISLYWFLGYGTRAEIKLETKDDKPVIIEFKVLPDGSIVDVKIVDDAGNFNLASRLISSVKNAAPLNPFPANIKEPSIDVRFNFYFF